MVDKVKRSDGFVFHVVLSAAAFILLASQATAAGLVSQRETLAGIPTVLVLVTVAPDLIAAGLERDAVQTDVELHLRSVGVRVVTLGESQSAAGSPALAVWVTGYRVLTVSGAKSGYALYAQLRFDQMVRLDRDPSLRVYATTWSVDEIVTGMTPEVIRGSVRDLSDKFANAYLSVNPVKREGPKP